MDREPRSRICEKKGDRDRLIRLAQSHPEWVLGFEDETWFSRFERPSLHSWADAAIRCAFLRKRRERTIRAEGSLLLRAVYLPELEESWLRFVDGRPVSP